MTTIPNLAPLREEYPIPTAFRLQIKGEYMRVGIATDHGGFGLKQEFVAHLRAAGHEVIDFGTHRVDGKLSGKETSMANGANTLTAVDLLIEAAKVERVIAMSSRGERVWLNAGDGGAHCAILSGASKDKLRRERNDIRQINASE